MSEQGEFYQKNLQALTNRFPEVVKSFEKESQYSFNLEGRHPFGLSVIGEEIKKTLHSRYHPLEEARRLVEQHNMTANNNDDHIFTCGFGLGYHVEELLRTIEDDTNITVIEFEPHLIKLALSTRDLTALIMDERFHLVIPEDEEDLFNQLVQFVNESNVFFQHFQFNAYQQIFSDKYDLFLKQLVKAAEKVRIDQNTLLYFAKTWPQNIMRNVGHLAQGVGIKEFFGQFKDCPGIVVSAGPSLDKNVDILQKAKGKAIIVAVGTALRVLLKKGIMPDLTITIDGGEANARHFEGLEDFDAPLAFLPTAHPKILDAHKGPKISISYGLGLVNWLAGHMESKGGVSFGGSVATAALDWLEKMGANPLIFVGQDLAYPGGQSHASGTTYDGLVKSKDLPNMVFVKGYYGGEVLSDKVLVNFLRWFEDFIRERPHKTFINATEGGADIAGTIQKTLQQVVDDFCQEDRGITQRIDKILADKKPPDVDRLRTALEDQIRHFNKLYRASILARERSKQLYQMYDKGNDFSSLNKILNSLNRLDDKIKKYNDKKLIDMPMQSTLLAVTKGKLAKGEREESPLEMGKRIAETSEILYANLAHETSELRKLFQEGIEKIDSLSEK